MNKQLTESQYIAQNENLNDIIDYANSIVGLVKRMRKDDTYISEEHLTCLIDDTQSIINLLNTIALRSGYKKKILLSEIE